MVLGPDPRVDWEGELHQKCIAAQRRRNRALVDYRDAVLSRRRADMERESGGGVRLSAEECGRLREMAMMWRCLAGDVRSRHEQDEKLAVAATALLSHIVNKDADLLERIAGCGESAEQQKVPGPDLPEEDPESWRESGEVRVGARAPFRYSRLLTLYQGNREVLESRSGGDFILTLPTAGGGREPASPRDFGRWVWDALTQRSG